MEVRGGRLPAFETLVMRHEGRLFNFLRQKTGDWRDAEDLTQKIFVTAFQKISLYDPSYRFETWLYTIARRTAIDHYRHTARRPALLTEDSGARTPEPVHSEDPSDTLTAAEDSDELWRKVREQLNENQFTALWLRYQEDLPIAEIASAMGKTAGNIKVLLHRARERLAQHLTQSAPEHVPPTAHRGAIFI